MNAKEIKEKLMAHCMDRVVAKKDGTFEARRGYFYTHGLTAEGLGDAVKKLIKGAVILECPNRWNPWPRDSYFKVIFKIEEPVSVAPQTPLPEASQTVATETSMNSTNQEALQ